MDERIPFLKFLVLKRWFSNSLLLPVLPHFSWFCQFSIAKIQKWGSVSNSGRVPQVLGLIPNYTKCKHCPKSLKDRGTLPLFDREPHFWIFAMLNRQNCEKCGKTGISKRDIKPLVVNIYGKFQFSISQNNVNFVVGGLKHKPGIFTIYAWLSVWLHCACLPTK